MKRCISILLLISLLLLPGCRSESSFEQDPVTETVTLGDFEIRATATGTVCPRQDLSNVTYTVEIRYVGTEPEVTLFGSYHLFSVHPDPQPLRWSLVSAGEGYYHTLKSGDTLVRTMSSLKPKYLPKGSFTMDVTVSFRADPTAYYEKNPDIFPQFAEKYSHTFRFPLTVK